MMYRPPWLQVAACGARLLARLRCLEAAAKFQAEAEALARAHAVGAAPDTPSAQASHHHGLLLVAFDVACMPRMRMLKPCVPQHDGLGCHEQEQDHLPSRYRRATGACGRYPAGGVPEALARGSQQQAVKASAAFLKHAFAPVLQVQIAQTAAAMSSLADALAASGIAARPPLPPLPPSAPTPG